MEYQRQQHMDKIFVKQGLCVLGLLKVKTGHTLERSECAGGSKLSHLDGTGHLESRSPEFFFF